MDDLPLPPDSRVRRVMFRLGVVKDRDDFKEIQSAAKTLAKKAGITSLDLDGVLWTVGDQKICGERKAWCEQCPLEEYCPKVHDVHQRGNKIKPDVKPKERRN